jgi:hypothetical protein
MADFLKKMRVFAYQPISNDLEKESDWLIGQSPNEKPRKFSPRILLPWVLTGIFGTLLLPLLFRDLYPSHFGDYATGFQTDFGEKFHLETMILESLLTLDS